MPRPRELVGEEVGSRFLLSPRGWRDRCGGASCGFLLTSFSCSSSERGGRWEAGVLRPGELVGEEGGPRLLLSPWVWRDRCAGASCGSLLTSFSCSSSERGGRREAGVLRPRELVGEKGGPRLLLRLRGRGESRQIGGGERSGLGPRSARFHSSFPPREETFSETWLWGRFLSSSIRSSSALRKDAH